MEGNWNVLDGQYGIEQMEKQRREFIEKSREELVRERTVAEVIDEALARSEIRKARLMKLRSMMESMSMLDHPVSELHEIISAL